jgi:RimJ/RimL family protein N-acetyltransferase
MEFERVTLIGRVVRLEPLSREHVDALCAVGLDPEIWRWNPSPVRDAEGMRRYVENALRAQVEGSALPFATIHALEGAAVGSTRFGNIDRDNLRAEIGWTWIGRRWQRTVVNTEAKYLMLRHAFESMGCRRIEFKTDSLNERSRAAIERIGATLEGILRNHMVTDTERMRHSAYYSILDSEWPEVKRALEAMLARNPRGSVPQSPSVPG